VNTGNARKKVMPLLTIICILTFCLFVNTFIVYAIPTTPSGLALNDKSDSSISLRWGIVNGVTGYDVYRDGQFIGSSAVMAGFVVAQYVDSGLTPSTQYRYKVKAKDASGESTFSSELVVSTKSVDESANVALGSVATASGQYNMGFIASNAVDGNINNWVNINPVWFGGATAPHWLKVDLGVAKYVNKFELHHGGLYSKYAGVKMVVYKIQGSNDGEQWDDLVTVSNNAELLTTHQIQPVSYRYFRVYTTDVSAILCEFKVFSTNVLGSVQLSLPKENISIGESCIATVVGTMSNGSVADLSTATVRYYSDNTSVADVDVNSGLITAKDVGVATITVEVTLNGIVQTDVGSLTITQLSIDNMIFKNSSGTQINALNNQNYVAASVNVQNNANRSYSAALVLMVFNGEGVLQNIGYVQKNIASNSQEPFEKGFAIPVNSGYRVIAFLWDSITGMEPIMDHQEIK